MQIDEIVFILERNCHFLVFLPWVLHYVSFVYTISHVITFLHDLNYRPQFSLVSTAMLQHCFHVKACMDSTVVLKNSNFKNMASRHYCY
jgi:hypothetical protein